MIRSEALAEVAALEASARKAVRCRVCFDNCYGKAAFIDLAQPRYIAQGYWPAKRRVAFVMLNPGAGSPDWRNSDWRDRLYSYRRGECSLEELFSAQREHMPYWNRGKLISFVELHGISIDEIALVNVAWCATADNRRSPAMMLECLERHTLEWLRRLSPDVVILSGTEVHALNVRLAAAAPNADFYLSFHYAHRPTHAAAAKARAAEIRLALAHGRRVEPRATALSSHLPNRRTSELQSGTSRKYKIGKRPNLRAGQNMETWSLIETNLARAGTADFDTLSSWCRHHDHAAGGARFVRYCIRNGWLQKA